MFSKTYSNILFLLIDMVSAVSVRISQFGDIPIDLPFRFSLFKVLFVANILCGLLMSNNPIY